MSSLCTPASNAAEATEEEEDACFTEAADNLDLLLVASVAVSKSATPPEVSMPLSLSLPELLELASSDIPDEEEELLLEELHD